MITEKRHPAAVALAMFYLGSFSLLAQMTFMREMLVVFYGNELSIGTMLASWLFGIGVGATVARFATRLRCTSWMPVILCLLPGILLPFQVYIIRIVRSIFDVPLGQYAPFDVILWSSLVVFFPTCFCIGFMFPSACEMLSCSRGKGEDAADSVSRVYRMEAFGSMLAGVAMTFIFAPYFSPYRIVIFAVLLSVAAAGMLVRGIASRLLLNALAAFLLLVFAFYPGVMKVIEQKAVDARWRALGLTGGLFSAELIHSADTKYQNLAVTELEGQYVLYGNGQVMFAFPDKNSYEHNIHFIMAQKPDAKRVLLLGGNPVGGIPELAKYGLTEIVYVDLDPGVGKMIRQVMPEEYAAAMSIKGVKPISQDALKFVLEYRHLFDVVIINAPDASTSAQNRFYTVEFYKAVGNILSEGGVVYTSIMSSARMQSMTRDFTASIYKSMKEVFSEVLVTSGTRKSFIAGHEKSENGGPGITFERQVLYERSKNAGIAADYFRPEYFLGLDSIDPWKTEMILSLLDKSEAQVNTMKKPVAYYYNLLIWNRYSESGLMRIISTIRKFTSKGISSAVVAFGLFMTLISMFVRKSSSVYRSLWSRWMVILLLFFTGFCGMGLEIIMVLLFQSLYGYVYTRMGFIVAVFMLGLVFGAQSGRSFLRSKRFGSIAVMLMLECVFLATIAFVPKLLDMAAVRTLTVLEIEIFIHLIVLVSGWIVGAQFPVANAIMVDVGGNLGASASAADAADHVGASMGALIAGVCLVPVLGIAGACLAFVACIVTGILLLISSFAVNYRV
ncbi:hypothetical protein BVX94_00955 [bacterium B17]|nr:hypothetical protein BVX94_00955 [bacterium B17]